MTEHFDIIVVGAGIVGGMVARFLSRYDVRILLIEKDCDVCQGASGANSATIHTGHSVLPGTLKADLNLAGYPLWPQLSVELKFPFEKTGDYVLAIGEHEEHYLQHLLRWGELNGVFGLEIISGKEVRNREPLVNSRVKAALWSPNTAICDPWITTIAAIENARANGVILKLNTRLDGFEIEHGAIVGVRTDSGVVSCRWVINAAGVYSDEIMHKAGVHPEFRITPRRGEYFLLDGTRFPLKNLLSGIPTKISKGIAVKRTIDGNVLVGSNAQEMNEKEDLPVTKEGLSEVWTAACQLIPSLNPDHIIGVSTGIRATGNAHTKSKQIDYNADFIVECTDTVHGLINLAGIESPGFTAAPAIALRVIEMLKDGGEALKEKSMWNPTRDVCNASRDRDHAARLRRAKYKVMPEWCRELTSSSWIK